MKTVNAGKPEVHQRVAAPVHYLRRLAHSLVLRQQQRQAHQLQAQATALDALSDSLRATAAELRRIASVQGGVR